jgi:dual-specificity kinase
LVCEDNDFAPFPHHRIQKFARQLLGSVARKLDIPESSIIASCVMSSSIQPEAINTDLKPENILLVHNYFRAVHVPVPER